MLAERDAVTGLPPDVTSYVGRRNEIALVRKLLSTGSLVTLTGPGGVGKTRLGIQIAATLQTVFPDGVAYVELAELRNPALLGDTMVAKLGLYGKATGSGLDTVVEHLRERRMLLLLDNCEHLIAACAALVGAIMAACPDVVILATSRQSLGVPGEQLLPVPPLAVPAEDEAGSPAELAQFDSVRLFLDRVGAVLPSFTVTAANSADLALLCRSLEGLPLAIELAAVRLRSLSLRQMTQRLTERLSLLTVGKRTAPDRQQSLRALIDWSYDLCTEPERLVWLRASVFSGTFDLDAAEAVCGGPGVPDGFVLDLVDSLIDKSILLREEQDGFVRYRMLETLREYGHHRLEIAGDAGQLARAHRDWYAELAFRFQAGWMSAEQLAWFDRVRRDYPNLRVALDYCMAQPGEAEFGLRILLALEEYLGLHGLRSEALMWLDQGLAAVPPGSPTRAAALRMAGWLNLLKRDIKAGVEGLTAAGEAARQADDEVLAAYVTHAWALAAMFTGEVPRSVELATEALEVFERHGDDRGVFWVTSLFGLAIALLGRIDEGRTMLTDRIAASEARGETFWRIWALWSQSALEILFGDLDTSEKLGREALRLDKRIGNRLVEALAFDTLAGVALRKEEFKRAATLHGIAAGVWDLLGGSPANFVPFNDVVREYLEMGVPAVGEGAFERNVAHGRAMPIDAAIRYALDEPNVVRELGDRAASPLTRRENQIAELVAEGLTNREIANRLVIAQRTAETHVEHILTKLSFTSRAQIAAWVAGRARAS
jgi:non-specific serine/threonine protein kinase